MTRKEKAHPGKTERTNNTINNNRDCKSGQVGPVSGLLLPGRDNAIPLRNLEIIMGIDGRLIRKAIERERRAGVPILADNTSGYYLPSDDGEIVVWVRSMKHRAKEITDVANAVSVAAGLVSSE